jgi:hypothetical protein
LRNERITEEFQQIGGMPGLQLYEVQAGRVQLWKYIG